MSNTKTEKSRT